MRRQRAKQMVPDATCSGEGGHGRGWDTLRSTQEMMPQVTLFWRCKGLPRDTTHSPTRSPALLPILTVGSGSELFTRMTARSLTLSKLATPP